MPSQFLFLTGFVPLFLLGLGLFVAALALAFKAPVTGTAVLVVVVALGYYTINGVEFSHAPVELQYVLGCGIMAIVVGKMFGG